jgi:hypothetical protein
MFKLHNDYITNKST